MKKFLANPLVIYLIKLWLLTVVFFGPICSLFYEFWNVNFSNNIHLADFLRDDLLLFCGVIAIGGFVLSFPVLLVELIVVRKIVTLDYSWLKQRVCISGMTMILVLVLFLIIDSRNGFTFGFIYILATLLSTGVLLFFKKKVTDKDALSN